MPLILAIVADPQEAAQLAQLIQGRLPVDLVQAAEVGEGLLALDDRIPDLILTSPLMSPFDDGVLDEYLRDLGSAGAHVQTLRIPVLSQAPKKKPRLGFSLRRRSKQAPITPEGCEPKVFADEIEQYLARAAEEKRHAVSSEASPVVSHQDAIDPAVEEEWNPPAEQAVWSAPESEVEQAVWSAPEPEQAARSATEPETEQAVCSAPEPEAGRTDLLDRPPVEDVPASTSDHEKTAPTWAEETVDASTAAAAPLPEQAAVIQGDIAAVPNRTVAAQEDLVSGISRTTPDDPNAIKATPSFKAALAAIRAAWGKPPRKAGQPDVVARDEHQASSNAPATHQTAAVEEPEPVAALADAPAPVEVDLTGAVEMLDEPPAEESWVPAPPEPPAPAPRANTPEAEEVYELSVEPDLRELESRLFTPMPPAPKRTAGAPPPAATTAVEPRPSNDERRTESSSDRRMKKKRGSKGAKAKAVPQPQAQAQPPAVQDEWGMFDPNRCGFAAVVDKLDEVADQKAEQPKNGNKVRVIWYS